MSIFAGLALLVAIQSAGEVEDALRRLRAPDLEERQSGDLRLASIAPALVDALLQLDPARRKADAATSVRLARIEQALREGAGPLLPAGPEVVSPESVSNEDGEVLARQARLVLYDVQDLTYSFDGPGVDIQLAGRLDPVIDEPEERYTGEELAGRAKAATAAGVWKEADGLSIQFQNGLLIVRHTREVHAQIARFLLHLRVFRGRKRHGSDGFYADLDRAERRVKELIDALSLARRALERERDAEDLELSLRAGQLLRAMEAEFALPGLRRLLEPR